MNLTTLGIDLAKNSFSLVGMDQHAKVVLRKTLNRAKLLPFIELINCTMRLSACRYAVFQAGCRVSR